MSIHNHWRNRQIGKNLLQQEKICFDFLSANKHLTWRWLGTRGYFYQYCQSTLSIGSPYQGVVLINNFSKFTPKKLVDTINSLLTDDIKAAYIAINRFEISAVNDLALTYPDCIEQSIDLIMNYCTKTLRRLYKPQQVDGHHFVGVHGLDVFVYESNHRL